MLTSSEALKHKLAELANSDSGQIDGGGIEIYWENQNGNEFSTEESIAEIAKEALERINELEQMQAPQPDLFSEEDVNRVEWLEQKLDTANELLGKIIESGADLNELYDPVHEYLTKQESQHEPQTGV